ncbi:MAG: transcriptional regulator with XRE-family HTH domain [Candidatus Omnitrophota bacterium]|jgi:transcriptional regulator with XRE-family HTH domain
MKTIGQTIFIWRGERGFTQAQLALSSGVSRPNISAIEQGSRDLTVQTLRRIASALELNPGVLVDGISPETSMDKFKSDRFALDRIARLATGENLSASAEEKKIATDLASIMHSKIGNSKRASALRGVRADEKVMHKLKVALGPPIVKHLIQRVEKILSTRWVLDE